MYGHSGVVSFYLKGEYAESVIFYKALKMIVLTASYGGFETILAHFNKVSILADYQQASLRIGKCIELLRKSFFPMKLSF